MAEEGLARVGELGKAGAGDGAHALRICGRHNVPSLGLRGGRAGARESERSFMGEKDLGELGRGWLLDRLRTAP